MVQTMRFVYIGQKTFWKKEKKLVTSILSFSQNLSKKPPSTRFLKKWDYVGKG